MTPLRQRMIDAIVQRGFAARTQVQQGLSAAGGALGFYQLGLAADKRYSLGRKFTFCAALPDCGPDQLAVMSIY